MAQIFLGPADNTYVASTSGDSIFGEAGNDKITASAGGNWLFGGLGADVLLGGAGNDVIVGDDVGVAIADMALNTLKGFGGNDTIVSYSWYDAIDAGNGDDTVRTYAQQTGQTMNGGAGTDIIEIRSLSDAFQPVNVTMGSVCITTIGGVAGATYLNFEALHFFGGIVRNTITGGAGDDLLLTAYLHGSNATNEFDAGFVHAGAGNDTVAFNGITALGTGIQEMSGGTGDDRLSWTIGLSGITDLTVDGIAGTMTGMGRVFSQFSGFETLDLRTYSGHTGNLTYTGIDGVDSLLFEFTTATIDGRGGDDNFSLNIGSGVVSGGAGNDSITISYLSTGTVLVHGDGGNDLIAGGSGQSSLYGDGGNDAISTYNYRSVLDGGSGDDVLTLGTYSTTGVGPGHIFGGSGRDIAVLNFASIATAFHGSLDKPNLTLSDGTILTGIEAVQITTGAGNDTLTASNDALGALANIIHSGVGNDVLTASANGALLDGGGGSDRLMGAGGADLLYGNSDADTLMGHNGNDTLYGGLGADVLTGGNGADHFAYAIIQDSNPPFVLPDLITDFSHAQGDRIDFSAIDANVITPGIDPFLFIASAAFHHVAGELRFEKVNLAGTANDHTLVMGDNTGDGNADFTIWLSGLLILTAADFGL